jgi:hypothetical protein
MLWVFGRDRESGGRLTDFGYGEFEAVEHASRVNEKRASSRE